MTGEFIRLLEIEQIKMERLLLNLDIPEKAAEFVKFMRAKYPKAVSKLTDRQSEVEFCYSKLTLSDLQSVNKFLINLVESNF